VKLIKHFYSLSPDWFTIFAKEIGKENVENINLVTLDKIGGGYFYFSQALPGVSVVLRDFILNTSIKFNKLITSEEFYILNFYPVNDHDLENNLKKNCNEKDSPIFNVNISHNQLEDDLCPPINERVFSVTLLVSKKVMFEYISQLPHSGVLYEKLKRSGNFCTESVDSKSIILLQSIKRKSVTNLSFDFFIKGISLRLLANFLKRNESSILE